MNRPSKVGPEVGHQGCTRTMGAAAPKVGHLESNFIGQLLVISWTWPMAVLRRVELGLVGFWACSPLVLGPDFAWLWASIPFGSCHVFVLLYFLYTLGIFLV